MATAKKDGTNAAAESQAGTSPVKSALTKYRKPITLTAIVAGGVLALGAAFAGGVAVAHNDRPHFGSEAMGAPHGPEANDRDERGERGEPGERGEHAPRGEAGEQHFGGPREQHPMGGMPGMGDQPGQGTAPAPTDGVTPTPAP